MLDPGVSAPVTISLALDTVGVHTFWALADRIDAAPETDETNNTGEPVISFVDRPIPDPTPLAAPTAMPAQPEPPAPGPRWNVQAVSTPIAANTTWVSGTVYLVVASPSTPV